MSNFVAIDFETTGIVANKNRVIEVGLVKFDNQFQIVDEYESLINPGRDVGRTDIHGIMPSQLVDAPTFSGICQDICEFIDGSILIAHNKSFDLSFLRRELELIGVEMIDLDALCTMELMRSAFPSAPRKLSDCCEYLSIEVENAHQALSDARMAAKIAIVVLKEYGYPAIPSPIRVVGFPPRTGMPISRLAGQLTGVLESTYLESLIDRLPSSLPFTGRHAVAAAEYLNLLDRVLEDRLLKIEEAEQLHELAESMDLSGDNVRLLHTSYFVSLCNLALADGELSPREESDIRLVASLLGVPDWHALVEVSRGSSAAAADASRSLPPGTTVCFTGTMEVQRDRCEAIATSKGLTVRPRVTKDLDILVVADPNTQSGKAKTARGYGTRIMSEAAFFNLITPLATISDALAQIAKPKAKKSSRSYDINADDFDDDDIDEQIEREEEAEQEEIRGMLRELPSCRLDDDQVLGEIARLERAVINCQNEHFPMPDIVSEVREVMIRLWTNVAAITETTENPTQRIEDTIDWLEYEIVQQMHYLKMVLEPTMFVTLGHDWLGSLLGTFVDIWKRDASSLSPTEFALREKCIDFSDPAISGLLAGKSIVISGEFLQFDREEAQTAIKNRGGKSPGSISGRTVALVIGERPGESKFAKSLELGIPILAYDGFIFLLDHGYIRGTEKN